MEKQFILNQVYCHSVPIEHMNGKISIKRLTMICAKINEGGNSAVFLNNEGRQFTFNLKEFNSFIQYNNKNIPTFYKREGSYIQLHSICEQYLNQSKNKESFMSFDNEEYYDEGDDYIEAEEIDDDDDYEDDDDFDDLDEDDFDDDYEDEDEEDDDYDDFDDDYEDDDDFDDLDEDDYEDYDDFDDYDDYD